MRRMYAHRKHTHLTATVPATDRKRFEEIIIIHADGTHTLTPVFTAELNNAATTAARNK